MSSDAQLPLELFATIVKMSPDSPALLPVKGELPPEPLVAKVVVAPALVLLKLNV
jgi:hypothetical protein